MHALPSQQFLLHPNGTLLQAAPFRADFYWAPDQRPLGQGAYGTVHRCWQISGKQLLPFAVKQTMKAQNAKDTVCTISTAKTEWMSLRTIQGVLGTVQLQADHSPVVVDNQAYIVLNLLPGCELLDAVEAKVQQPYDSVWMQHLAQQLCTVVANMHERGIAWRDAKPQNIMCTAGHGTDNPLVAVFDFGLSLPMKQGPRLLLQKVDMVGTPEYMSPEVLQGMARKWSNQDVKGQSYDAAAADVWSVGAVLYGAATGQPLLNRFDSPARMADTEINENELSWDDLQYVMQCQTELLEDNMAEKWAELAERTSQSVHEANSTLEAFLKPLLHPDPAQRPTLAAMLNHPYLQHAGPIRPPLTSEPVQMSAALPSMLSVMPTVHAPALLLPEMGAWSELEAVPGMGSVFWAPKSHYLYATMPGNVFRSWELTDDLRWERCLLKRICLYEEDELEQYRKPVTAPVNTKQQTRLWNRLSRPRQKKQQAAEAHALAVATVDLLSLGTQALQDLQKAKFILSTAFSFANNVHFSLYRLPGGEIKFLCQEIDDRRAESQPDQQHAFKDTARQLLEMLEGLHAQKVFLGAVQPERILVEPTFCLAECCPGDWLETVSTLQRLAPEVMLNANRGGRTQQDVSSAEGDMWSAGVVLYELATGRLPFPGSLPSGRTLASQDVLPLEERKGLRKNVYGQLCRYEAEAFRAGELEEELVKSIGRQGAEVVMNMLNPYPDERLTATQALQTPYLSKGSAQVMQPSQTELTPTAHAVHGQVGQQPPEGLEHIEAQAHAAAADQQQLSLPVVHDRLNGAALSEHAQTELYNGKGDASQGTAVIKACTKTDQPSWNERSKDSGQGLQNGGHKVSLAAHAGQLGVPLLHKPQDGVASIDAAQEQPALDSAAERDSHAKADDDSSTGSLKCRVNSWLHRKLEACKGLVKSPHKCCSSKGLRVK